MHQNRRVLGKLSGKKSLLLMNRVVSFLQALTFPSRDGISPHGSVACAVSRMGLRAALAVPNSFMVNGPKKSPWLSLTPANTPRLPSGNSPHGCNSTLGINGHLPGVGTKGWGRKGWLHPFSNTGGCFCTGLKQMCQLWPWVWAAACHQLPAVESIPAETSSTHSRCSHGLPTVGCPCVSIRESHKQHAEHGAEVWGGEAHVLCSLPAQVQEPRASCSAQYGKSHHALHQIQGYTNKKKHS